MDPTIDPVSPGLYDSSRALFLANHKIYPLSCGLIYQVSSELVDFPPFSQIVDFTKGLGVNDSKEFLNRYN